MAQVYGLASMLSGCNHLVVVYAGSMLTGCCTVSVVVD